MCFHLFVLFSKKLHLSAFAVAFTFLENTVSTFRKGNSWEAYLSLYSRCSHQYALFTSYLRTSLSVFFFFIILLYINYLNFTAYFRIEFGGAK